MVNCLKCGSKRTRKLSGDFLECLSCAHIFSPRDGKGRLPNAQTERPSAQQPRPTQQPAQHTRSHISTAQRTSGSRARTSTQRSGSHRSQSQYIRGDGAIVHETRISNSNLHGNRRSRGSRGGRSDGIVIKCGKCGNQLRSSSNIRPITINCKCGAMIVLK